MDENDNFLDAEGRIKKEVIKEGRSGRKAGLGWKCHVKLEVSVPSNINIDSDYKKENSLDIQIGNGNWFVDRMIEACLETMKLEEESNFTIPLTKAVDLNNPHDIEVKIVLESAVERPYIFDWSEEDKISTANDLKSQGVELFKANRIRHAFHKFSKALKVVLLTDTVLKSDAEPSEELENLRIALYNNMAGCQLHFKNYKYVIELCNKSLEIAQSLKAYYRRGLAFIELREYEKAENDLIEVLKLEPKNKVALEKIHLVRSLDKDNRDNYTAIVKKMFL